MANLLLDAAAFAAHAHRGQRRKCKPSIPYINHPIEVARILSREGKIEDEEVLAAALLHDTIEDTMATQVELQMRFGERVADLVREVTDDKAQPKDVRKQAQIDHAPHISTDAQRIKVADKIHNIRSFIETPPEGWSTERILEYCAWAEKVVAGVRGCNEGLETAFDMAVSVVRQTYKGR